MPNLLQLFFKFLSPSVNLNESIYSRVPNKQTGRLLENEKKSHLYSLIQDYTFINFQQKVPPICLFPLTLLLIFVLSMAHFDLR